MNYLKMLFFILLLPLNLLAQESGKHFFVFLNTNPNKEQLDSVRIAQLQEKHLANIDRLYTEGKIIAAGPFYGGGGLFIFKESSIENVQNLLQTDPAIAAKRFLIEIYPLRYIEGQVCSYDEPIEMITLSFIRIFQQHTEKTENSMDKLQRSFGNELLTSAIFELDQGGFAVLDTDFEILKKQVPILLNTTEEKVSIKQLYIAKGTFCSASKK